MVAVQLSDYDKSWIRELIKQRQENWITTTKPQIFIREGTNVVMLVYEVEGIIFKRIIQH